MKKAQLYGTRRRTVHFADPLSAEEQESLLSAISQLECTTEVIVDELQLVVNYEFPACCYNRIWQLITRLVNSRRVGFVEQLRNSLAGFAEQNEMDHRLYPRHWQTYVKDIYVHYFDLKHNDSTGPHKHLWRRYQHKH